MMVKDSHCDVCTASAAVGAERGVAFTRSRKRKVYSIVSKRHHCAFHAKSRVRERSRKFCSAAASNRKAVRCESRSNISRTSSSCHRRSLAGSD